jgi:hypothetical protein
MSLLPSNASFEERVQDVFTAYRGRGVSLSAIDVELAMRWASMEIPFEVVARGMRKAAEAQLFDAIPGEEGLRSLKSCRVTVEAEIKKYLKRMPGQTDEAKPAMELLHVARHKKLKALLREAGTEHPELGLSALADRLKCPTDFEGSLAQEERVCVAMLRALPFFDRSALLRQARALMQKAEPASTEARLESLRFHRAALIKKHLALPGFW